MRCVAYCTAESYHLNSIAVAFKEHRCTTKFHHKVLYVCENNGRSEIFFFNIGCFVIWNSTARRERELIKILASYSTNSLTDIEFDHFIYDYAEKTTISSHERFNIDIITLEDEDVQKKLAIAYGLAQSVKLDYYEESVQHTIKKNSYLPIQLAKHGKITQSGRDISKRMGEIFIERSSVNLSSEYLDMPEYFWEYPNLEDYYLMAAKFLDISNRVSSLNQRLDVLHELFNMLTGQLQHRHSNILEMIIIILIMVEVILSMIQFHL